MMQEEELKEEYATYSEHITHLIRDSKEDVLVIFSPKNSQEKPDYVQMVLDNIVFRELRDSNRKIKGESELMKNMKRIKDKKRGESAKLVVGNMEIHLKNNITDKIKTVMEGQVKNGMTMSQKIQRMAHEITRKTIKEEPTINLNDVSNKTILFDGSMMDIFNSITFVGECKNVLIKLPDGIVSNKHADCIIGTMRGKLGDTMQEILAKEIANILAETYQW